MHSKLPKSFYKNEQQQITLKSTALPTGILKNPLDLINNPKPWITVAPIVKSSQEQKKTLFFLDSMFYNRSTKEQDMIVVKLRRAKLEGFAIFILQPQLRLWDGIDIPRDFTVNLEQFTEENIYQLAYQQLQLSSDNVLILDYFVINELLEESENTIYWKNFRGKHEQFLSLIKHFKKTRYQLNLERTDDFNELFELIENESWFPFDKFKGISKRYIKKNNFSRIDADNFYVGQKIIERIFQLFPYLEVIDILFIKDAKGLFAKIAPQRLMYLKHFYLFNDLSEQDLDILFNLPLLETLELMKVQEPGDAFQRLKPGQLKTLKKLTIKSSQLNSEHIELLLNASPALETLTIEKWNKSTARRIRINQLMHLKEISITEKGCDSSDLKEILAAAPNLKQFNSQYLYSYGIEFKPNQFVTLKQFIACQSEQNQALLRISSIERYEGGIDWTSEFSQLKPNQLSELKEIVLRPKNPIGNLSYQAILSTLLASAPNITQLKIYGHKKEVNSLFEKLPTLRLNYLEEIELRDLNLSAQDLIQLITISPNLQKLFLYSPVDSFNQIPKLNPEQLMHLNSLGIEGNISVSDLLVFFSIATNIESLTFNSSNLSNLFAQMSAKNLLKLRELSFYNCTLDHSDLIAIFNNAKALKSITLRYISVLEPFSQLIPGQLQSVQSIILKGLKLSQEDKEALGKAAPYAIILYEKEMVSNINFNKLSSPLTLDESFFNTQHDPNKTLRYTEYFPGNNASLYRLSLWKPNLEGIAAPTAFNFNDFEEIKPDDYEYLKDSHYDCSPGIKPVCFSEGKEIILPSLSAEEKLFGLQVTLPNGRLLNPHQVKIKYHSDLNFYGLQLPYAGDFTINYQVAIPNETFLPLKPPLPSEIQERILIYKQFGIEKESLKIQFNTLKDFAHHLQKEKKGDCKQRCIAAYEELVNRVDMDVKLCLNDLHALLEFKINGRTYLEDLGGYPNTLEKNPIESNPSINRLAESSNIDELTEEKQSVSQNITESLSHSEKTLLVKIIDNQQLYSFYTNLCKQMASEDLFIAHDPQALNLTALGFNLQGKPVEQNTPLRRWLEKHRDKPGIIVVDIREFTDNELPQLNDLLDRTLEDQKLESLIRIILLDSPMRRAYGPDFKRRVPNIIHATNTPNNTLLTEVPGSLSQSEAVEINLFHSAYWHRLLVGHWQLYKKPGEQNFSFQWQQGELFKALHANNIVFRNPPLYDPSFTTFIAEIKSLRQIAWADQTTKLPTNINFYQTQGFYWEQAQAFVSLHHLADAEETPLVLSDANVLHFIQDPAFFFSPVSSNLEAQDSYLTLHQRLKKPLSIICAPGLSTGTFAQFLNAAEGRGVKVQCFLPTEKNTLDNSPLRHLNLPLCCAKNKPVKENQSVSFIVAEDSYFIARKLGREFQAPFFHFSYLDKAELGCFPVVPKNLISHFLATGQLSIQANLSHLAQQQAGQTIVLYGTIPSHLYETLMSLSLGYIEGIPFKGKLVVVVPPEDSSLVQSMSHNVSFMNSTAQDKLALLNSPISKVKRIKLENSNSFAQLEQDYLFHQYQNILEPFSIELITPLSDEDRAKTLDNYRVSQIQKAFQLSDSLAIEGPTGAGKTYFLHHILIQYERIVFTLEEWFNTKSIHGEPIILVIDEANFLSELTGQGENFLERFISLKSSVPIFLYKGQAFSLSPQHKVLLALNPENYGSGRKKNEYLTDHCLRITFKRLPDYYVRANIVKPLLENTLGEFIPERNILAHPLTTVYQWILAKDEQTELITPRDMRVMVNLLASIIIKQGLREERYLALLANEVAFTIGQQSLGDAPTLLEEFNTHFKPSTSILNRSSMPANYLDYQQETYCTIQNFIYAKNFIWEQFVAKKTTFVDLGLGGILLEGGSGIGKTYFLKEIIKEYEQQTGKKVYRISASTPYHEKERLLKLAYQEKTLVVGEEFNTSPWPNKLLNSLLMNRDDQDNPIESWGLFLLLTQNPPSFIGRMDEDPAIRKRLFKIKLNWPVYKKELSDKLSIRALKESNVSFYSISAEDKGDTSNRLLGNPSLSPFT